MVDDVVIGRSSVSDCLNSYDFGAPRVRCASVFLVFRRADHLIVELLEGSLDGRWIRADVVGGVTRELLCLNAELISFKLAIEVESFLESALGGSERNFSFGNFDVDFVLDGSLVVSVPVKVDNWVFSDEVAERASRVDACVSLHSVWESTIRPYGLRHAFTHSTWHFIFKFITSLTIKFLIKLTISSLCFLLRNL